MKLLAGGAGPDPSDFFMSPAPSATSIPTPTTIATPSALLTSTWFQPWMGWALLFVVLFLVFYFVYRRAK